MGWNVDFEVRRSAVHGCGLFAAEPIPAGTRIWQVDASMRICDQTLLARLAPSTLARALKAGYVHEPSGLFVWYTDGMQFMNHGEGRAANVGLHYWPALEDDHTVALRDIELGEELREDYRGCLRAGLAADHWLAPFYRAFCPSHYRFLLELFALDEPVYPAVVAEGGANLRNVSTSLSRNTGFDRTATNPHARHAA